MQNSKTMEAIKVLNRLINAVSQSVKEPTVKANREERVATAEALALLLGRKPRKIEVDWSRSETWEPTFR
jgi:hypothetical protein